MNNSTNTDFPTAFFTPVGDDHYQATAATSGPWSPEMQHGSPPCALLVHVMRQHSANSALLLSRVTIEFLGPVPLAPCRIKVETVRAGKRIELLRGSYYCGDKLLLIANAWNLLPEEGVTADSKVADDFVVPPLPPASAGGPLQFGSLPDFKYDQALKWHFARGKCNEKGPATVWFRQRIDLIEGEPADELDLLFSAVDSANGISAELDPAKWSFVPVDMTVNLFRQPVGEWLGMSSRMVVNDNGIGQTKTTLFDQLGSMGAGLQTLFIRPRPSGVGNT
jgi:hypothetical protein